MTFGLLVSRKNRIIGGEERILRFVPANFRFPSPCLGWWKSQDMPPREGQWKKKSNVTDLKPFV